MKKTVCILSALALAGAMNLMAQGGPGGGGGGGGEDPGGSGDQNQYDWNYSWSNYFHNAFQGENDNGLAKKNKAGVPATWKNQNQIQQTYGEGEQQGTGELVQNRFGKKEVPADAEAMIRQFQQDRQKLMIQLKTCTDEERQQLLKEMEQLRTRIREEVARFREQAQEQAQHMRQRFANERDRLLDQGAGSGNGGPRGGRDR